MDLPVTWTAAGIWFALFMLVAHGAVYLLRNRPTQHKWIMYFGSLIGGLGLITTLFQSREQLASWHLQYVNSSRSAQMDLLVEGIQSERDYLCELHYVRSAESPRNFDELVKNQEEGCVLIARVLSRSKGWLSSQSKVSLPELTQPPFKTDMERQWVRFIQQELSRYNASENEAEILRGVADPVPAELMVLIYGPFALIAGFSLGLAGIMFPAAKIPPKSAAQKRRAPTRAGRRKKSP